MKVKTHVKAGGMQFNHNQTLVRDRPPAPRPVLKVKTRVKAGGISWNHNQTLVRDMARQARGPQAV
jgi:hypothetical protein